MASPRDFPSSLRGIRSLEPQHEANIDCIMEYRWENNFSPGERDRERERERERNDRARPRGREPGVRDDSIRNVFGPRARLVKSFAGIMNPTRIVISTRFFLLAENKGEVELGDCAR